MDLIIQHNMYVVHNGQLKHSDLSGCIIDIQLDINQLNFRLYIEMIQNRNESYVVARSQLQRHQRRLSVAGSSLSSWNRSSSVTGSIKSPDRMLVYASVAI